MPATTTARLVSPRQQNFIASLASERVVPEGLATAVRLAAEGTLDSRGASALITRLMDAPRTATGETLASRQASSSHGYTVMPTPSETTRAGRMLKAGGVEATVTLDTGEHVTLRIRSRKSTGRGWTNCSPFDEGARINMRANGAKVGWINVEGSSWKVSTRTRNADVRAAINALFSYAAGEPTSLRVQEASRCGRCMRTLTDPVSIARGIGPECFGRGTGSRAARIEAGVEAAQVGPTMSRTDAEIAEARQRQHDRDFAAREREQEEAAFASDPDYRAHVQMEGSLNLAADALLTPAPDQSLSSLAAVAASPVLSRDQQRARDLISEALDAYCSDGDRDFAMRIFDQLAAR